MTKLARVNNDRIKHGQLKQLMAVNDCIKIKRIERQVVFMMRYAFGQVLDKGTEVAGFCRGGWMTGHMSGIGMLIGGLVFLGLIVLLTLLIVTIVRNGRHHPMNGYHAANPNAAGTANSTVNDSAALNTAAANALAILNERYAKGEINQDEYLSKKSDLLK